jgi:hypothetical protein
MKLTSFIAAFAIVLAAVGVTANAASVEYRILINDVVGTSFTNLAAGASAKLTVEGRVMANEVVPGSPGGFIQASFNLEDTANALVWEEGTGFLGAGNGLWKATANAAFGNHNAGTLQDNKTNVLQETVSLLPSAWDSQFGAVGAGAWGAIASGNFTWNGTATTLNLTTGNDVNLVSYLNGAAVGGRAPDTSAGASATIGIPEPATLAMAGLGMIGMLAIRRRS